MRRLMAGILIFWILWMGGGGFSYGLANVLRPPAAYSQYPSLTSDVFGGWLSGVRRRDFAFVRAGLEPIPVVIGREAPVLPVPGGPGTMTLFLTGLVTAAEVVCRKQRKGNRVSEDLESWSPPSPGFVLFVSKDEPLVQGLVPAFVRRCHEVEVVSGIEAAADLAGRQRPGVVLVDRRLSGWRALRRVVPFRAVPMMTLIPPGTVWNDDMCVADLDVGIDATHVCDESPRLLVARARALLRRSAWQERTSTVLRGGNVELNVDTWEVRIAGNIHHLPPIQFRLLMQLMKVPGKVFLRSELLAHIWGEGYVVERHTLDVHLSRLRQLLRRDVAGCQEIATVRGIGVKFVINAASGRPVTRRLPVSRHGKPQVFFAAKAGVSQVAV